MKKRRLLSAVLCAALGLTLWAPGAAAGEKDGDHTGYVFRVQETPSCR